MRAQLGGHADAAAYGRLVKQELEAVDAVLTLTGASTTAPTGGAGCSHWLTRLPMPAMPIAWPPWPRRSDAQSRPGGMTAPLTGPCPSPSLDPSVGCEGWGDTPLDALNDLACRVREDTRGRLP